MKFTKLKDILDQQKITPEFLAFKSKGNFSNMTVRRALAGKEIDILKAKAIAVALKVKTSELL